MGLADETKLLGSAYDYALDYVRTVDARPVYPTGEAIQRLESFVEDLPDEGTDGQAIMRLLHEVGSPATVAQTGGRYFGFVNGGALPISIAARWLADVWDQNTGLYVMSPVAATLEGVCETWLVDLLGLPEGTAAGFVNGSSAATLCGLAAARNQLLKRQGWDVAARGLFGAPPIRVVIGEEAHATVLKALSLLGLGSARVERVPADDQGRLDPAHLPVLDDRTLLVLQAGNVNTGAFDRFDLLCEKAKAQGAWVHVDGAFGLWAAASDKFSDLTASMSDADSWSADAHKTLNVPYDCGIVFCADRAALADAMALEGSYILYSDRRDGMRYTPDMSRRARGVELWAALKSLGRGGVSALVEQLHERASSFAGQLAEHGFQIANDVCFNQFNVVVGDERATQAFTSAVQSSEVCWCGTASRRGQPFIRVSVCSHATTDDDISRSVEAFLQARAALSG